MLLHTTDKTCINLKNTFMENVAVNYAICILHVMPTDISASKCMAIVAITMAKDLKQNMLQ